ncbi:MAG: tetratricopeptide repeat protein [Bacteroidales bacterium]
MRYILIISTVIVLICGNLFAEEPDSLFFKANRAYANAYYSEAVDNYLMVVDAGYESAGLYFNLGNAYFKLNDFPSAILYYEKAKKLDPNNEDIKFNLGVANSKIVDKRTGP